MGMFFLPPWPGSRRTRNRATVTDTKVLGKGDWVQIRSAREILATLNDRGELDNLPFMPEMLRYCGQTVQVAARAHKTCDTISKTGGLRMRRTVHLDGLRCDGSAHGGCDAACLIFWKEDWLVPLLEPRDRRPLHRLERSVPATLASACGGPENTPPGKPVRWYCQATELLRASTPLKWWDPRQYYRDVRSGNVRPRQAAHTMFVSFLHHLMSLGVGYRLVRQFYEWYLDKTDSPRYPFGRGTLPLGTPTPVEALNLQPGERVKVKPLAQILATMTHRNRNRGLYFDAEMTPFCEREFVVRKRVGRIINEASGEMMEMKTPCITLDGVVCKSRFSCKRLMCPRAIPSYWREIWLERTSGPRPEAEREH